MQLLLAAMRVETAQGYIKHLPFRLQGDAQRILAGNAAHGAPRTVRGAMVSPGVVPGA